MFQLKQSKVDIGLHVIINVELVMEEIKKIALHVHMDIIQNAKKRN